jgi:recombination protein U
MADRDYGAELEQHFQKLIHKIKCYSYKPIDFKSLIYAIANIKNLANRMPKAPCDRMIVYKGKSYFFELKHSLGNNLPYNRFTDHQIGHLLHHKKVGGGKSYVVIGFRRNRLDIYAVEIEVFLMIKANSERKFITKDDCREFGFLIKSKDDLLSLLEK